MDLYDDGPPVLGSICMNDIGVSNGFLCWVVPAGRIKVQL